MRIVYLYQHYRSPDTGGGLRAYEFARRWVKAGHDVHVVSAVTGQQDSWRVIEDAGVVLHQSGQVPTRHDAVSSRLANYAAYAAVATPRTRSLKPDVVYASSTPLTVAVPAIASGAPYVFETRDMWPDVPIAMGYLRNPVARRAAIELERQAYRRAAHIVTLAPGMRDAIIAKGLPAEKVTTVTQGCDTYLFDSANTDQLHEEHRWLGNRPLIVYIGSLGPTHGVEYAADLAQAARARAEDWVFVVIGGGNGTEAVRAHADRLGVLGDNFHMLGYLPKAQAAVWFRAATLNLALGQGPPVLLRDSVNNKFFDGVAAGVPTASNFDGFQTRVSVAHGVGFQIPHRQPAEATAVIANWLKDGDWMAGVPHRCRQLADGPFNRDTLAREALGIVEAAAGS